MVSRFGLAAGLTLSLLTAAGAADLGLTQGAYVPEGINCETAPSAGFVYYDAGKGLSGNGTQCDSTPVSGKPDRITNVCREQDQNGQYTGEPETSELTFQRLSDRSFKLGSTSYKLCRTY